MATHIPTINAELPVATAMSNGSETATSDWKTQLPVLQAKGITLRELRVSDAHSLLALLTTEEVTRFVSPPPTTIEGFERFILWAQRERGAGLTPVSLWCLTATTRRWACFRFDRWIRRSERLNGASHSALRSGVPASSYQARS